jgi:hypothetical protein
MSKSPSVECKPLPEGIRGQYDPLKDQIVLSPELSGWEKQSVLAHEQQHARDRKYFLLCYGLRCVPFLVSLSAVVIYGSRLFFVAWNGGSWGVKDLITGLMLLSVVLACFGLYPLATTIHRYFEMKASLVTCKTAIAALTDSLKT